MTETPSKLTPKLPGVKQEAAPAVPVSAQQAPANAAPAKPPAAAPKAQSPKQNAKIAAPAKPKARHMGIAISFILIVVVPVIVSAFYLFFRAQDQYTSSVGFSVRSEDISSAIDVLGGLGGFGGGSSSDTDILYEYIKSQELVRTVDNKLDLRTIYSKPYDQDPVFAFNPDGTIEDLTEYWARMVKIFYDSGTGLIELRVHAFTPTDAQRIAQEIFVDSSQKINDLSAIAREDATRYSREELDRAVERLRAARKQMTEFRSRNQIINPEAEIGAQTGLMSALQGQLSAALIERDLLRQGGGGNDPRISQAEARIEIIEARIEEERLKYSSAGPGGEDYSTLIGEYEGLVVDREFAEQSYLAALAGYDSALIEAQRQSRYLAAYTGPSLAERSEYPQRGLILILEALFLFFSWGILVLVYYAIRDRR